MQTSQLLKAMQMQTYTYHVKGMHCAACENLIESELLKLKGAGRVDASMARNSVTIDFDGVIPDASELNELFEGSGYLFSEDDQSGNRKPVTSMLKPVLMALAIITLLALLIFSPGFSNSVAITPQSTYGAFFLFGLLAGVSSCAALTGGLVLSLASQWNTPLEQYPALKKSITPNLFFNTGRIAAYTAMGALLGLAGETMKISSFVTNTAVLAVSVLMLVIAFQMLEFRWFNRFRTALPKKIAGMFLDAKSPFGSIHPLFAGCMTILLPCGFTIVAEGAAMLSGSMLKGAGMMLLFAAGTVPALLAIGLAGTSISRNRNGYRFFLKTAGLLVIFAVAYNLNVQFGIGRQLQGYREAGIPIPGKPSASTGGTPSRTFSVTYSTEKDISPQAFAVKRGEKVRIEVNPLDTAYGCMSTIMVPGLWEKPEPIVRGKRIVMEFTPLHTGSYRITCAMGVPRGVITVR